MKLLLDTSALIFLASNDPRLSKTARDAFESEFDPIGLSAASLYEVVFKTEIGKLVPFIAQEIDKAVADRGFQWLSVEAEDARLAGRLPLTVRDPWDRVIAAQAIRRSLTVISIDDAFDKLGASRLW